MSASNKKKHTRKVRLVGGPLNGEVREVPSSSEMLDLKFFKYDYAGMVHGEVFFVKRPSARVTKRFIAHYVATTGKHPAVVRFLGGQV